MTRSTWNMVQLTLQTHTWAHTAWGPGKFVSLHHFFSKKSVQLVAMTSQIMGKVSVLPRGPHCWWRSELLKAGGPCCLSLNESEMW